MIQFNKDKTRAWLGQPHLIKNLQDKFGEMVRNLQTCRTPGTPGQGIVRLKKDDPVVEVSKDDHSLHRSGVGMIW